MAIQNPKRKMKPALLTILCFLTISTFSQTNNAVSFDGTNDHIAISDNNAIDLSADFTLEAWIYPTGTGSSGTEGGIIFNKESSYEIARFPDGTIRFALSANGAGTDWTWTNSGLTAPLNRWSHVTLIKNGTNTTIYLNASGSYTAGSQPATLTANTQPLIIGGRTGSSQYFAGYIDNVRIWNVARSLAQIKENMYDKNLTATSSNLVAYYKLNEGSGTTAANFSTNFSGLNGTLTNGPTWLSSPVSFFANALQFDGSNDNVVIPKSVTSDFTIEYWVSTTSTGPGASGTQWYGGNGIVDAEVPGGTNDFGTALTGSKLAFGIGNPDVTIHSVTDINTGAWFHVAVTWQQSSGAMRLYINGVLEASGTGGTALRSAPSRITLGQLQTNIQYFNGAIDELRIWNTVRSQAQIQASKNSEIDPTSSNLVAYYMFNQGLTAGTNTGIIDLLDMTATNNGTMNNFSLSGSSSNFVAQNSGFFLLPVQWGYFEAKKIGDRVQLNWLTEMETNTSHFTIEFSQDLHQWQEIGTVRATGNSSGRNEYSYLHAAPVNGMNYYRIKQVDLDGRTEYSGIRQIRFMGNKTSLVIQTNPVQANTEIKVLSPCNQTISLFDMNGKMIWKKQVADGLNRIALNGVKAGVYVVVDGEGLGERIVVY